MQINYCVSCACVTYHVAVNVKLSDIRVNDSYDDLYDYGSEVYFQSYYTWW